MSAIAVLKEAGTIVLGTDSRFVTGDRKSTVSDSVEKITEISAETFLATSGYSIICDFQNAKACELSRATQDIRTLSGMLAEASKPILEELVAALAKNTQLHPLIASAIAGEVVLHGAVLVGRSCGELGYVYMQSRCADGRVQTELREYFGAARKIAITSATDGDCLQRFRDDGRLWTDPPISVVNAILDTLKRASSAIGGPTQIVRLNSTGARWVSRLPEAIRQAACPNGLGTITAAIELTSPTLVITGGNFTMNVDSTHALLLTTTGGPFPGTTIEISPSLLGVFINSPITATTSGEAIVSCGLISSQYIDSVTPANDLQTTLTYTGISIYTGSGNPAVVVLSDGVLEIRNLPSSNPGAGTKRLYYNPSTGAVMFAY